MVDTTQQSDYHFVVKAEAKKFDSSDDVRNAFNTAASATQIELNQAKKITLGGNSYGFGACEWLAEQFK